VCEAAQRISTATVEGSGGLDLKTVLVGCGQFWPGVDNLFCQLKSDYASDVANETIATNRGKDHLHPTTRPERHHTAGGLPGSPGSW
jgi:hypothetical protein